MSIYVSISANSLLIDAYFIFIHLYAHMLFRRRKGNAGILSPQFSMQYHILVLPYALSNKAFTYLFISLFYTSDDM